MFEQLSDSFSSVFDRLTRKGTLTEADVETALRDVRIALLNADVSLPVVKSFVRTMRKKATGQAVMKSVTPGHQVIKIVHDELVSVLTCEDGASGELRVDNPPAPILMVGLQGSGKTTTTAKLAKRLANRDRKRVIMASLDTRRPAAMRQLEVLGEQAGVDTLPIIEGQSATEIATRAMIHAANGGYDACLLDTAGRLHIDNELMDEVAAIRGITEPRETLLIVDGLTGQDAVNVAQEFEDKVGVTGVVLTRMEGDGRGGAALSMRAVTGKPIKFVGLGEKLDDLGTFDPERIARRILGMGDILSLVEKAKETLHAEFQERAILRMRKGRFNMNDMRRHLKGIEDMGGMSSIMSMMPGGMSKAAAQIKSSGVDEVFMRRYIALIDSMTKQERANPHILKASRKRRIAAGAGLEVPDLNMLIKTHDAMAKASKRISKGFLNPKLRQLLVSGKMPDMSEMEQMMEEGSVPQMPMPGAGMRSMASVPRVRRRPRRRR